MKFASFKTLLQGTAQVLKRFPFELFFALAGTLAGIMFTELKHNNPILSNWCLRTMMTANLGFLLSLSVTLYTQSKTFKKTNTLIFKIVAAAAGISLILLLNPFKYESDYTRFMLFSLALHLLVAFSGFLKPDYIQGFWQFNKTLFLRFLTSVLYSTVLYAGIAAAIGAMNFLFNFNFESDTFMILWIITAGIFNTLFFLAGVPHDLEILNQDFSYPKSLKVFTQYVLIPLATIYVVILIAYEIKILITWNLPKGLVSTLILSYAVFGILSVLLIFPIRGQEENKWIKTYARSFYLLMLPLLLLLFIAVGARIFAYGITQSRYFLILLACWLLFITLYFLVSKKQNIKLIPISLSILTLLSLYGPQSVFSVAMYSQRNVLISVFKKYHLFENGRFKSAKSKTISNKDAEMATSALNYLLNEYGTTAVENYLNPTLFGKVNDSISKVKTKPGNVNLSAYQIRDSKEQWIREYLRLEDKSNFNHKRTSGNAQDRDQQSYYNFLSSNRELIDVKGYDLVLAEELDEKDSLKVQNGNNHIQKVRLSPSLILLAINGEKVRFDLKKLALGLLKNKTSFQTSANDLSTNSYRLPDDVLMIKVETKSYQITFKINTLYFGIESNKNLINMSYLSGYYLIKKK